MAETDVRVPVACDCGAKFEVPIAGKELEGLTFTCPGCGADDSFTEEQRASIVSQYEAAAVAARNDAAEAINDAIDSVTRGSKNLKRR